MKKLIAMILALVMVLALTACGNSAADPNDIPAITKGHDEQEETPEQNGAEAQEPQQQENNTPADKHAYSYTYEGVELVPGAAFDPSALPEADSVYEVPSCAIEGTDNLYNYGTFELTAFNDGTGEVIYSIFFIDPNITTDEGLALGDDVAKVIELYGEDYTAEGTAYIYTGANTILSILVQNDTVTSIEFRMEV